MEIGIEAFRWNEGALQLWRWLRQLCSLSISIPTACAVGLEECRQLRWLMPKATRPSNLMNFEKLSHQLRWLCPKKSRGQSTSGLFQVQRFPLRAVLDGQLNRPGRPFPGYRHFCPQLFSSAPDANIRVLRNEECQL